MNKELRPQKNAAVSFFHLLDLIAAGAAVLAFVAFGAISIGRWLLGG